MDYAILAVGILGLIGILFIAAKLNELQQGLAAAAKELTALKQSTEGLKRTVEHHGELIAEQQRHHAALVQKQSELPSDPISAILQSFPQLKNAKWMPIALFAAKQLMEIVRMKAEKREPKNRRGILK